MHYLDVAVPAGLEQTFTYTAGAPVASGVRVKVSFGRQTLVGVVVGCKTEAPATSHTLKPILEIMDQEPVYSETLLKLAHWMAQYYLYPLGDVLRSMLPVSLVKKSKTQFRLTEEGLKVRDGEGVDGRLLRELWPKKMALSQKNLKAKLLLWEQSEGQKLTLKKLETRGWVHKESSDLTSVRSVWPEEAEDCTAAPQATEAPPLTPAQTRVWEKVFEESLKPGGSPKTYLLHGVTGAGKTEVYLKLILETLALDPRNQVMVLVPEIALTPQMTRIFSARFPGQVGVVHSAMLPAERWSVLQSLRQGQKRILIGPRSAVFAAFEQLSLLIVDEEHDSSYKQGSGLSYNGRDVAVMRGHLEARTVILGSATPSMESYANAVQNKYQLLELPDRANARPMPEVTFVKADAAKGYARKLSGIRRGTQVINLPIDESILEALRANHAAGRQSMVLVNRRGYAYFLMSLRDKKAVSCPHCSISLTVHKSSTQLRCHYCDYQTSLDRLIPLEQAEDYVLIGFGSEQMEQFLREGVPGARIQRVDSDSTASRDALPQMLESFRAGDIDILVGTQMLAKGHDFAKVTLICILEIDQTLNLPDFRAGERTFQLMVQAAGRAGRGEWAGEVLVQTQRFDHPVLEAGRTQNYAAFWQDQLPFRQVHSYPPFSRMIVFELSASRKEKLLKWAGDWERWIKTQLTQNRTQYPQLSVLGPSIPPLETIRGRTRRTVLLMSPDRQQLWRFARALLTQFQQSPGDLRLRVDVDPQSLM